MSDYCLPRRAAKEFCWPFSMFLVSHTVILIDEDFFLMLQMKEQFMSFLNIHGRCLLPEHQKELQTLCGKQSLYFIDEI